jgi:transcription-repair coupling factor (superfamily II helicase)
LFSAKKQEKNNQPDSGDKLGLLFMRKIISPQNDVDIEPLLQLLEQINGGAPAINASGLAGAARSFVVSLLAKRLNKSLLVICPEEKEAKAFVSDLSLFLGEDKVLYYPPLDFLAIDMFALQKDEALERLQVLTHLQVIPEQ